MRSQLSRIRSNSLPLTSIPPKTTSAEYSLELASLAARILYRSPLPSPNALPILILNAAAFPDAKTIDYNALLPYVLARLPDEDELLEGMGYEIVFFAGQGGITGAPDGHGKKKGRPTFGWFLQAYRLLSRAMRKRLQKLIVVHERGWVRVLLETWGAVVSPKFRKKIVHVNSLNHLSREIPIEDLLIPPSAYLTDRRKSHDTSMPDKNGKRAFGKQRLPISSDSSVRLPRVLRETTSFVIMDPLVKTEGVFRISASAQKVEILREAFERGQKFIVWREGDTILTYPHYQEGKGDVSIGELDQTEGYELHAAAALIKLWYKLADPIFPQSSYQWLEKLSAPLTPDYLLQMLSEGPEWTPLAPSRQILILHLLPLLSHISGYSNYNKMTPSNLALCFAPNLIRGPDPIEDVRMSAIVQRLLTAMIENWPTLAPALLSSSQTFGDLLRLPSSLADREDPIEEFMADGTDNDRPETRSTGITMLDNADTNNVSLPPNPPSPIWTIPFATSPPLSSDSDSETESIDTFSLEGPEPPPPPLPPRPRATTSLSSSSNTGFPLSPGTDLPPTAPHSSTSPQPPLKRKPAPALLPLPRYSVIIRDRPALPHIQHPATTTPHDADADFINQTKTNDPAAHGETEAEAEGPPRYSQHFACTPFASTPLETASQNLAEEGLLPVRRDASTGGIPRKPVGDGKA